MADEGYNQKMEVLQQYIPFLENMIEQLKDPKKKNREQRLSKMQSLLSMITDKRKKLKIETLVRCEDIISNMYKKVHNKPIGQIGTQNFNSPMSTPASPSPNSEFVNPQPPTIPTERVAESRIPKIDVYNRAAESLNSPRVAPTMTLNAKIPDMSKPPISLEDLKTLEEDVHDKINESCLQSASLNELRSLKDMLEEQLVMEDIKATSPTKRIEQTVDTTARNSLNLSKKNIQSPEKRKVKETIPEAPKPPIISKTKDVKPVTEYAPTPPKKDHKAPSIPSAIVKPKILKEPGSIFGSILSNIDGQILEGKKKKEERRSSLTGKDEKTGVKESKSHRRSSTSKDEKKQDDKKKSSPGDKSRSSSKDQNSKKTFDISGKKSVEAQEKELKQKIETKEMVAAKSTKDWENAKDKNAEKMDVNKKVKEDSEKTIVGTIGIRKEQELKEPKEETKEEAAKTISYFKRLADKYNPKPKKPPAEPHVSRVVAASIEQNMKASPPKIPLINQLPMPVPPPASLVRISHAEPEAVPPPSQYPAVLQNIMLPSTTQLINTMVSQLRQSNAEAEAKKKAAQPAALLPTPTLPLPTPLLPLPTPSPASTPVSMIMSSPDNFVSAYARDDNFTSDYIRDSYSGDEFVPNQREFSNANSPMLQRHDMLNYEPPEMNQFIPNSPRYVPPHLGDRGYNDNFPQNRQFPAPHRPFSQNFNNFNQNAQMDIQPLDYYPPNAPMPANQYNGGPPLLSPEVPHYQAEQKPNHGFGIMPNHYGHHEDMQWRPEDNRSHWDANRPGSRDPRTYREYREMRESRDPRVARDNPRDPRIRDPRENRDNRDPRENQDPRENRDRDPRENRDRDPRLNRDRGDRMPRDRGDTEANRSRGRDGGRSQSREFRSSRYDSKFDRVYARTNFERPRSRSRSRSYTKDTFASPLDSLYTGKDDHQTGKGYGVQNFRIPKIKKEDEEKEQSTKVTSTNEELNEAEAVEAALPDTTNDDAESEVEIVEKQEIKEPVEDVKVEDSKEVKEVKEKDVDTTPTLPAEPSVVQMEPEQIQKPAEPDAKPADQTILAQFFANLLGSQNKKDKKTALYSLINTFSDSFSHKQLSKITKIIKTNDDDEEASSTEEEEEETKKADEKAAAEKSKQADKDTIPEEAAPEDGAAKPRVGRPRRRIRRISSGALSREDASKEEETAKSEEHEADPVTEETNVIVTVGERIKSRKRASTAPQKPKKKCKTELDLLHEDIQDMFIRDGVLTASGKRMCRLLKGDPNALTPTEARAENATAEQPQKVRKKPGPKPKPKPPNAAEVKAMKSVRVVINKIPDSTIEQREDDTRRSLRRSNRITYAESDDDSNHHSPSREGWLADAESIEAESVKTDESEVEISDAEDKEKTAQTGDNLKSKVGKRKRGKGWASGIIPNKKKKKKFATSEEPPDAEISPKISPSVPDTALDKSFVEPDKDYYLDYVTRKPHACKLCSYHGRYITTHYKISHPDSEVLTSRFSPTVAAEAIKDSASNLHKYESVVSVRGGSRFDYRCRFCDFSTSVQPTFFYDHVTTHTGEYRHCCPSCDFSSSNGKSLKAHMRTVHENSKTRITRKSYACTIIFGYICGECNYVQMSRKLVEEHINIFHLEKPVIYKVNMSKYLDPEICKSAEDVADESVDSTKSAAEDEEKDHAEERSEDVAVEQDMPPPQNKTPKQKPGPKCSKKKIPISKKTVDSDVTDSESVTSANESEEGGAAPEVRVKRVYKRRSTREVSLEEEPVPTAGRGRRAAKDKATEKLKVLMEATEGPPRKKPSAEEAEKNDGEEILVERKIEAITEDEADVNNKPIEKPAQPPVEELKPAEEPKPIVKKEVEMNVFTCKTDLLEENKKIEQERLQLMDELNKSMGSRTSLNFVDKLCDRLSNNDVIVKQEPRDYTFDSVFVGNANKPPLVMPVLERSTPSTSSAKAVPDEAPPPKKPVFEAAHMQQVSNPSFDVTQKNDKVINDMIQKLKGKLGSMAESSISSPVTFEDNDYDSEGPPPLTHVNELVNVKPSDGSTKTLLIGDVVKVIKNSESLTFSCLVPPCVFSTGNQETFQEHCRDAHMQYNLSRMSTLCEMCGMEVTVTDDCTLLENLFKHMITVHADFIKDVREEEADAVFVKPPGRVLRIRKLSGDALSIKKDWEEELAKMDKAETETDKENQNASVSEVAVSDAAPEAPVSMAELDVTEDNPFPFKIAGVMSLAEPQPPPLAPLAKTPVVPGGQLVVKEAKLTQAELSRSRKSQKAMARFLANISDLYKCPHYYCLFTTNYRDFLERHLKTHLTEHDIMVPCVYCDMKTPWEHIPMHIDIRHAHCRFACNYCLYRAVMKEYVFLHQDQMHPKSDYSVIALPQPKNSRRYAIADVKMDAKNLCEPYQCSRSCKEKFLFENEFRKHLYERHPGMFLTCGYQNCQNRVISSKMISHWCVTHRIAIYQCGYCRMSASEIEDMYYHFAKMHQSQQLDILIRMREPSKGPNLGFTPEAFSAMRVVVNMPRNLLDRKNGPLQANQPAFKPFNKATLQVVTSAPETVSNGVLIPASQAGLNRTITLVSTGASTSATGNILLLPNVSSYLPDVSGMVMASQPTIINSVAALGQAVQVVPSVQQPASASTSNELGKDPDNAQETENIAPLEHINLGEDTTQAIMEDPDVDPLSLDADVANTSATTAEAYSSEDETDNTKSDKGKKVMKTGLLSYQLFRCAFCDISSSNSNYFRKHVTGSQSCRKIDITGKPFVCVHCGKNFKNANILVEHIHVHGILRFSCSLCGTKFSTSLQARTHIKTRHNIAQTTVTALHSVKTNIDTDEYIVRPKLAPQQSVPKDASASEPSGAMPHVENIYKPDQVDMIPMRHILSSSIKCGLCSYSTKVRTNMVRHLHFHLEEKAVSDIAPVNPVPCLEKNEKMFDKMINLASSSHSSSRMGGTKAENKEKESEHFPEFVPTHCRYVCCARGCNYICPEEGNLRHHLLALHVTETLFTCVHCKADLTPTDADNLIKHFKLHSLQLHKCHYCTFVHYLRHKVERHVSDAHADMPVKVVTIRSMDSEPKDASQEPEASTSQAPPPTPASNKANKPWRCCMCKYKSGSQGGIQNHALEKHEIDVQFKCALCSYKTNEKETFADHFKGMHDDQSIDIIYAYCKEEDKEKEAEAFDTTPLWQRDRPRVRHIRGILFDDSIPLKASPKKVAKSPSIASSPGPSSSAPSPLPSTSKTSNVDLSIESVVKGTSDVLKEESSSTISDDFFETVNKIVKESIQVKESEKEDVIVIDDEDAPLAKNKDNKDAPVAKNRGLKRKASVETSSAGEKHKSADEVIDLDSGSDTEIDEFSERNLKLQFGAFGTPLHKQLKCPVCNQFKSKRISDFIFHLFKEMKVYRFKCKICSDESITYRYMYKHVQEHNQLNNCSDDIINLPPNERLQAWLQMVIREQSLIILQNFTPMPDPVVTSTASRTMACMHCDKKFATEAERNEHGIVHWAVLPYACNKCMFSSYSMKEVEKHCETAGHFIKTKNSGMINVLTTAPTIEKELRIADDLHRGVAPAPMPELAKVTVEASKSSADATVSVDAEDELSENDLVIVTKTDSNVPIDGEIFCCEYCPFMTNSEMQVIGHITGCHSHMHVRFKTLNRATCEENVKDHVGCMNCEEFGSEISIRQHHMEKHDGQTFMIYRYTCALCDKKCLKLSGMKMHFNRCHPGFTLQYAPHPKTQSPPAPPPPKRREFGGAAQKCYKCTLCPYSRNFTQNATANIRSHLKQHFKPFMCGICRGTLYRTRPEVVAHFKNEHPGQPQDIIHNVSESFRTTMQSIINNAVPVDEKTETGKNTARKSTSAPHDASYSFYGQRPEPVDLSKIMTSVEVNGMALNMSAERLTKIFDLDVYVSVEDCNLSVDLTHLFDS